MWMKETKRINKGKGSYQDRCDSMILKNDKPWSPTWLSTQYLPVFKRTS